MLPLIVITVNNFDRNVFTPESKLVKFSFTTRTQIDASFSLRPVSCQTVIYFVFRECSCGLQKSGPLRLVAFVGHAHDSLCAIKLVKRFDPVWLPT
jgi:hypothetical protein